MNAGIGGFGVAGIGGFLNAGIGGLGGAGIGGFGVDDLRRCRFAFDFERAMTAPQKDDVKDHQQRNERVECGGDDEKEFALLRELWIEDDIEESPIDERHEYAQTDDLDDAKRNALGAIR